MHVLSSLAWRFLAHHRLRTALSVLAVALGAAMTVAADVTSGAVLNALSESEDAQTLLAGLLGQLDSMLTLIGVAITFAAGFLLFNAFAMSITQRRRRIGLLRCLGMTRWQVVGVVLAEAVFTGASGTVLGLVAGPLLARATIGLIEGTLGEGVFVFAASSPSISGVLLAAILGMGVTLLAALIPAWGATRTSPLAALHELEASGGGVAEMPRTGHPIGCLPPPRSLVFRHHSGMASAGAVGIAALATYLMLAPPGEWVEPPQDVIVAGILGFSWLSFLALVLPALVGAVGQWGRGLLARFSGATGRLIADGARRGRGRVTLTILTLALALAMIVGVTGFIHFAAAELLLPKVERTARLGAWLVTTADFVSGMATYSGLDDMRLPPGVVAEMREAVQDRAQIVEWHFVAVPELSFFGSSYFSFVLNPREARRGGDWVFTFTEGDWGTALPIMEAGCGVLIMPLVASRNGVSLGETFEVTGIDGPVACTVAGIGSTYVGASIISSAAGESFGTTAPLALLVWPLPGVDRNAFAADMVALVDSLPGAEARPLEDMSDMQSRVIDLLPNLFNALLLLAILAAAMGVVNTTVMSVTERRRELGLLRAVGATRRQVRAVVTGEAALIGLIGGGLGLLAGVGIVVIVAVTYGGNAWGMPGLDLWAAARRSVRPALLTGLAGLCAAPLICAGAAWLPARAAVRAAVVETLKAGW